MTADIFRRNGSVSNAELQRRWAAIRKAMDRDELDCLVVQCSNDYMGGYARYLTDIPALNGYPFSILFPREGGMTWVRMGPAGGVVEVDHEDPLFRGVERIITSPSFTTASYTRHYDADLMVDALSRGRYGRIGLVGTAQMPHAFVERLNTRLPSAQFIEASDLLDRVRAWKSAEEIKHIRETAALQDCVLRELLLNIRVGMLDRDVVALALYHSQRNGSEQGIYGCRSGPVDKSMSLAPPYLQNHRIRSGDQLWLLVENNGPSGLYGEIGRTFVFGSIPQKMKDEFQFTLQARAFVLDQLRPGTSLALIAKRYDEFMVKNGRPAETRIFAHSQGYDMVERPLVRSDEDMVLAQNTYLAIHPTYNFGGISSWICDNFLIGEDGKLERLHSTPEEIFQI